MIHPHSCDMIPVCNKLSLFTSDDRCITSIYTDTGKIIKQHLSYSIWIHDQKCQTILPEITPAPSSLSVIMMRKEWAAINTAQDWLKTYPVHKLVEIRISGMISDIYFFLPVCLCFFQFFQYHLSGRISFGKIPDLLNIFCNSGKDQITAFLFRL